MSTSNSAAVAPQPAGPALRLDQVSFHWPSGDPVFTGLELELGTGELLGLVGPNGSGKTTLLRLLAGLLEPSAGHIEVFGTSPAAAREHLAYVPQHAAIPPDVPASVLDVVLGGRLRFSSWGFRFAAEDHNAARGALERTGCLQLVDRPFGTLSGGQRQRVLIARALASPCRLLLLDEPTANVDARATHAILEVLDGLRGQLTMVLVSHDLGMLCERATRIAWLHGRLDLLDPHGGAIDRLHAEVCGRLGAPTPPPRLDLDAR